MESAYLSSLEGGDPMALVLLAHYAVILHIPRQDRFAQEKCACVVETVRCEWMLTVHRPMQQVGLRTDFYD